MRGPLFSCKRGEELSMNHGIEDVSDENYEQLIHSPAAVVVYGIASCEPCAAYDPILARIAHAFPHVRIGKAKMHIPGRCREIKRRHQFTTYPTTHFFSQGRLLHACDGKLEEHELAALITQYLPPSPDTLQE
ncbi:MAG: thioredoxin [Nitrospirae bacterium]|nr:MAG: thioredoxin [Nitrospirota bacterium]